MSRAFSTLEGIGLSCDENYAILPECYPYLAKRLLSDDSPRAREALRTLLFSARTNSGRGAIDVNRLSSMATGLQSYTSSIASAEASASAAAAAEQLLSIVLAEDGSFAQSLLLSEAAASLDAAARVALTTGPARDILTRVPVPALISVLGEQLLAPDEDDAQRAAALASLLQLVRARAGGLPAHTAGATSAVDVPSVSSDLGRGQPRLPALGSLPSADDLMRARDSLAPLARRAPELAQEVGKRRAAIARTATRFGGAVAGAQAERLRGRVERANSVLARQLGTATIVGFEAVEGAFAALDRGLAAAARIQRDAETGAQLDSRGEPKV
jgi:aarF domain-containing kinase